MIFNYNNIISTTKKTPTQLKDHNSKNTTQRTQIKSHKLQIADHRSQVNQNLNHIMEFKNCYPNQKDESKPSTYVRPVPATASEKASEIASEKATEKASADGDDNDFPSLTGFYGNHVDDDEHDELVRRRNHVPIKVDPKYEHKGNAVSIYDDPPIPLPKSTRRQKRQTTLLTSPHFPVHYPVPAHYPVPVPVPAHYPVTAEPKRSVRDIVTDHEKEKEKELENEINSDTDSTIACRSYIGETYDDIGIYGEEGYDAVCGDDDEYDVVCGEGDGEIDEQDFNGLHYDQSVLESLCDDNDNDNVNTNDNEVCAEYDQLMSDGDVVDYLASFGITRDGDETKEQFVRRVEIFSQQLMCDDDGSYRHSHYDYENGREVYDNGDT